MPRKKRVIETVLEDEPEKETQIENEESDIENALKSVPGGVTTVKLYRVLPQGGRPKFLTELSPEEFSESNVKEMYGGGSYKIRAQKGNGKWGVSMFDIDGPPKKLAPVDMEDDPDEEEPAQMHQQPQQVIQQAPQLDPFMMMKMLQQAEDRGEARMMKMLELMRPQQQNPDVTKQVFEIVEKIAPMMAGGDGGSSPWMMALTQFREPIMKIVDSIHQAVSKPSFASSGPPPQVHADIQPNPPQPPKEDDMIKILIRQYLPVFVNAARNNGNPDIYADMVLEQIPETMYPKLEHWLNTPTWFLDLTQIEKNIEFQAGWWNLLRTSLLEGMKPDAASNLQSASDSQHGED
jgi:hypothetical protein